MKIEMKAEIIHALAPFASTEETRFYLKGVALWAHPSLPGVIACALDGYRLAMLHDKTATVEGLGACSSGGVILATVANKDLVKQCKPAQRVDEIAWRIRIEGDNNGADVAVYHADSPGQARRYSGPLLIDGTYPNVSRAIPTATEVSAHNPAGDVGWDYKHLALFGALARDRNQKCITIMPQGGAGAPARVYVAGRPEALCVLMPLPSVGKPTAETDWWHATEQETGR